jgi:RimJ/RimL family protein N-acetyltransferase
MMPPDAILKTERLTLRPLAMADAPALFAILGDPTAMTFWDRAALPRLATVEALLADELAAMAAGHCRYWTIFAQDGAIGGIDLSHIEQGKAELGFLLRRDRWGQGLAREAVAAVITAMPLALHARIQAGNDRAVRLVTALDFRLGAILKDHVLADGRRRDCARYERKPSAIQNGA